MASLRDVKEFILDIESRDPEGRTVVPQDLADMLQSLAKVGGCMSFNEGAAVQVKTGNWTRIDGWQRSIDTQGVKDGLDDLVDPGGWYKINNAAAGDYTISCALRFTVDKDGDYEIRVATANDGAVPETFDSFNTPYHDRVTLLAGEQGSLNISGAIVKDIARGERIQIEFKAPNNAGITPTFGTFGVQR